MDKRTFLKNAGLLGVGTMLSIENISELVKSVSGIAPAVLAKDEEFWASIRKGYKIKPDYINLENGYYCFLPEQTIENFI